MSDEESKVNTCSDNEPKAPAKGRGRGRGRGAPMNLQDMLNKAKSRAQQNQGKANNEGGDEQLKKAYANDAEPVKASNNPEESKEQKP